MIAWFYLKVFFKMMSSFALLAIPIPLLLSIGITHDQHGLERLYGIGVLFIGFYALGFVVVSFFGLLSLALLLLSRVLSRNSSCIAGVLVSILIYGFLHGIAGIIENPFFYFMMIQGWVSGWIFWKMWEWAWRPGKAPTSLGWVKKRPQV